MVKFHTLMVQVLGELHTIELKKMFLKNVCVENIVSKVEFLMEVEKSPPYSALQREQGCWFQQSLENPTQEKRHVESEKIGSDEVKCYLDLSRSLEKRKIVVVFEEAGKDWLDSKLDDKQR